jgi:hypothetical protein
VIGLYYSLTKSLTLVGEYSRHRGEGLERQRSAGEGRHRRRNLVLLIAASQTGDVNAAAQGFCAAADSDNMRT